MWRMTLIALLIHFSVLGQRDTSSRQVELSVGAMRLYGVLYTQCALGVNFPAQKPNWYNNLALSINIQDATKRGGSIFALYSLSAGKSYQWVNNRFFGTLGLNTGLFYGNFTYSKYIVRHMGINLIPKGEIGYNMKNVVLSAGVYFSTGFGYREEYINGNYVNPGYHVSITGALNPYIKLILK